MGCSMKIEQKMCQEKIFQLQSMFNTIKYVNQSFAVILMYLVWPWYCLSCILSNLKMKILKAENGFKFLTNILTLNSFFLFLQQLFFWKTYTPLFSAHGWLLEEWDHSMGYHRNWIHRPWICYACQHTWILDMRQWDVK